MEEEGGGGGPGQEGGAAGQGGGMPGAGGDRGHPGDKWAEFFFGRNKVKNKSWNLVLISTDMAIYGDNGQKFGTSPVGMNWDRKHMIPTQSQLFAIPSPDQPPMSV